MVLSWSENWTGTTGAAWPAASWSVAGAGTATIQANAGRLLTSTGTLAAVRARFEAMANRQDCEILLSFTPQMSGEWYLTIGTRTYSNNVGSGDDSFTTHGMYAQVYNFFGPGIWFARKDDLGARTNLSNITTGLPTFSAGTQYKVRFRVQGPRMYIRVWAAAGVEPTTWNMSYLDPDAYEPAGKITVAFMTDGALGSAGVAQYVDLDDLTVTALGSAESVYDWNEPGHTWTMWSRASDYKTAQPLPIISASGLRKHLGVDKAVISTPFTEDVFASLQPSGGVVIYRDGVQQFSGLVGPLELDWDADSSRVVIRAECVGDVQHLDDRIVFTNPAKAADDQQPADYWTYTGVASTAMKQLISDQAGPTAHLSRRVTGLALGADPGVGISRTWTGLFDNVLAKLTEISVASGQNLGVRATSNAGTVTFDIVKPRDLASSVKFSVEFGNVAGIRYRIEPPTVTDAVSAGSGDLHLRVRRYAVTASSFALSWGRRIWSYIDRRDTAVLAELDTSNADALADGDGTVSLAATLLDTEAAAYGTDWDLGDKVTVYVRVPGQDGPVATVVDVVREIAFTVDDKGAESIRPAIGTFDAKSVIPTPTQKQLLAIGQSLAGLSRK